MLHGWGLNLKVFDTLCEHLDDFNIVCLDLPGHGRAAVPSLLEQKNWNISTVAKILLAQMPPKAIVLGWSLGATIALEIAKNAAHRVNSLVLVSATPRFTIDDDWPYGTTESLLNVFAHNLMKNHLHSINKFLELQVRGSIRAAENLLQLKLALQAQGACSPTVLRNSLQLLYCTDLRVHLKNIKTPTLVIAGQYDRVTHPMACVSLAKMLPNARYLEIRRGGHVPFLSHPVEFCTALKEFTL